jgi:hypothetical protein
MEKQKSASAQNRGKVIAAGDELVKSVDVATYADKANQVLSAVVLAVSQPQDQIRIFVNLSVFETGEYVPGLDGAVQDAATLFFQRLALAYLGALRLPISPFHTMMPGKSWRWLVGFLRLGRSPPPIWGMTKRIVI